MGKLEEALKIKIRKTKVNRAVIAVLATAGLVSLALVAPNAVQALGKLGFLPQRKYQARQALSRMIRAGYVRMENHKGRSFVRLTSKGEAFAAQMHLGKVRPRMPKRWDGKWRMVIFDIPERRRGVRARVREVLRLFNFYRLQNSVWVCPYDAEDLIIILKAELKVGKDMLYLIADTIENDAYLRRHFNLHA